MATAPPTHRAPLATAPPTALAAPPIARPTAVMPPHTPRAARSAQEPFSVKVAISTFSLPLNDPDAPRLSSSSSAGWTE